MSEATQGTPEQEARDMLERMGVEGAQRFTAGQVVELANLLADKRAMVNAMTSLERAVKALKTSVDRLTYFR